MNSEHIPASAIIEAKVQKKEKVALITYSVASPPLFLRILSNIRYDYVWLHLVSAKGDMKSVITAPSIFFEKLWLP